jgi:dGTPase
MASIYEKLISGERLRKSTVPTRNLNTEMLSDKSRIVLSSAFRRLQIKAQVFSLEKNAAIRSRLTHTLEVAFFGELMAEQIFENLLKNGTVNEELRRAFVLTVENACLLHDIGNPPFGHLGEFAIRGWFDKNEKEIKKIWNSNGVREKTPEVHLNGFKNFDGNAQGFRIITKLQWLDNPFGLNLTCSLLASVIKYLSSSPNKDKQFSHKVGFFETEKNLVYEIWKRLELKTSKNELPLQRHPFTFIMEAADDIAYSVHDIEDAIEKRVVVVEDFFNAMRKDVPEIQEVYNEYYVETPENNGLFARFSDFSRFRIKLIRELFINKAVQSYIKNEEKILSGEFEGSLLETDETSRITKDFLQSYARKYIYTSHEAIDIELSGHKIIHKILDGFLPLLRLSKSDFDRLEFPEKLRYGELALERRLFSLLPNKHFLAYKYFTSKDEPLEIVLRTHLLIDYLSGMTDSHAVKVFDVLQGISTSTTL